MTNPVFEKIESQIKGHPIVLYMKGTPEMPQCGFSAHVVKCLQNFDTDFAYVNILENEDIRQGLKEYSNWPTFPQLYVKGELVGGCDIVSEMYESGELETLLKGAQAS